MKPIFQFNISVRTALFLFVLVVCSSKMTAQVGPAVPDTSRMTFNQISSGLGLFAFPANGQSQSKQKENEFVCYMWAIEQSGIDPLNLPKIEAPAPQTGPTGGAVRGAARGAAAGVAIGAVAGDAGRGAAIGATAGALSGRSAGKQQQAQQNQRAQASVANAERERMDTFVRAFSVCMEGKGYTIR
jgi:hypothetical protein